MSVDRCLCLTLPIWAFLYSPALLLTNALDTGLNEFAASVTAPWICHLPVFTLQIQKSVRGLIGRRKAQAVREELLHQRVSVAIQSAWRGLLARRELAERRRDVEAVRVSITCTQ